MEFTKTPMIESIGIKRISWPIARPTNSLPNLKWIPEVQWKQLQGLTLLPHQRLELKREMKSAYRISQWIAVAGEHGHWKGGQSGDKGMFVKNAIQYIAAVSKNSRWYRMKRGYSPLLENLYKEAEDHAVERLDLLSGIKFPRTALVFRVSKAKEIGNHLDRLPFLGKPDLYLAGGVYYGKISNRNQ